MSQPRLLASLRCLKGSYGAQVETWPLWALRTWERAFWL